MPLNKASLAEMLTRGINPDPRNVMNQGFPVNVEGFEPSPYGLIKPRVPSYGGSTIAPAFLGEQLIKTSAGVELREGLSDWLEVVDLSDGTILLFDGSEVVMEMDGETPVVYDGAGIATACEHLGRVYMAGELDSVNEVISFFDAELTGLDQTCVYWTAAGYEDLFYILEEDGEDYAQLLDQNDAGWIQLPDVGEVLQVLPRGDSVMVYGSEAIYALQGGAIPVVSKVLDFGLANRGAAVNAGGVHRFVSSDGIFYEIGEGLTRLEYGHVFRPLLVKDLILTFDPVTGNTYLSTDARGFLYNQNGLAEIAERISSIVVDDEGSMRTGTVASSFEQVVEITQLDFQDRGFKTLRSLQVLHIIDQSETLAIGLLKRESKDELFEAVDLPGPLKNGYQQVGASGVEFDLKLSGDKIEIISDIVVDLEVGEALYVGDAS